MKKVRLNKHDVVLYDSIDELPIVRFHKYNHLLLIDAGIGADIKDFDKHIERVALYIRKGENENAAKEIENLRQNVFNIMQGQSLSDLSFACLVKEIDGKAQEDMSVDGLVKVLEKLGGTPRKELADLYQSVKKKIDDELILYFPSLFDDVQQREYYDIMKRMLVVMLNGIAKGDTESHKEEVEKLRDKLVLFDKPKVYTGHDGVEVKHDKDFESMCLMISTETNTDAKTMTTLAFYNAYEYINEKARKTQNKAR